ncbi:MAG: SAM-dependent methyltransferase, partial [Clostridia bacterium]|nr:SAM-dependent methyltransferase [Clostridia bacterium]
MLCKTMVLDERLAMMASLGREKVPLADIGTDHAYLPIRLLLNDPDRVAMATDIRPGPLEAARRNARLYGVEDRIDFRLADGFLGLPLTEKGIRDIYLCGMGGETIAGILKASGKNLPEGTRFYLQPM